MAVHQGMATMPMELMTKSGLIRPIQVTSQSASLATRSEGRYTRRLSDKIVIAFHHACDEGDIEVAQELLGVLELLIQRPPPETNGADRRSKEGFVAAHERLWQIRHA
jgi:hypothetical protein